MGRAGSHHQPCPCESVRKRCAGERLAFRGGTALCKLHLIPPARYSEDIDLVQVVAQPIGETLDAVRAVLDPWLGTPRRVLKEGRVSLLYRFDSEDTPSIHLRLKIEINTREHFAELGLVHVPFTVSSGWFQGSARITTFTVTELLATKLRALYQRSKGRDLFDLWLALNRGFIKDPRALIECFRRYLYDGGYEVTRAQFEANLHGKRGAKAFRSDIEPLLAPGIRWDADVAMDRVLAQVIAHLPGDPWKGRAGHAT